MIDQPQIRVIAESQPEILSSEVYDTIIRSYSRLNDLFNFDENGRPTSKLRLKHELKFNPQKITPADIDRSTRSLGLFWDMFFRFKFIIEVSETELKIHPTIIALLSRLESDGYIELY